MATRSLFFIVVLFCLALPLFVSAKKSDFCMAKGTKDEKLSCLISLIKEFEYRQEPLPRQPIDDWPGNSNPVGSHLFLGLLVSAFEVSVLYFASKHLFSPLFLNKDSLPTVDPKTIQQKLLRNACQGSIVCTALSILGTILSGLGWLYWFIIFSTFWNFISWLMLTGWVVMIPGLYQTFQYPKGMFRDAIVKRRFKLIGWTFGAICLIMFPNLARLPQQIYRRFNASTTVILPQDPLVLQLAEEFFSQLPREQFDSMTFQDKMLAVDEFIKDTIIWKSDMSQYGLVGLLTSAHEVIERRAGDCQGQAVTTASLLLSMGYQAWVVETAFHWWTHAEDNETGQYYNLNTHGGAGLNGDVLPQAIDMIYTAPAVACNNCSFIYSHNTNPTLYVAPPWLAFPMALTGAHIFKRSGLTLEDAPWTQITIMGLALGFAVALFGSYYQADGSLARFLRRLLVACPVCVGPVFVGMCFWASVYYPVTLMHLISTITFIFSYVSCDSFNLKIGTPILKNAC